MSEREVRASSPAACRSPWRSRRRSSLPSSSSPAAIVVALVATSPPTAIAASMESYGFTDAGPSRPRLSTSEAQTYLYPSSTKRPVREYQLAIARAALLENTLVSLPTGFGKTLIASVVMHNFGRWFPDGACAFVAPTKPLVEQQLRAFCETCGVSHLDCRVLTGEIPPAERRRGAPRPVRRQNNDVNSGLADPHRFVCVAYDEVHHAHASASSSAWRSSSARARRRCACSASARRRAATSTRCRWWSTCSRSLACTSTARATTSPPVLAREGGVRRDGRRSRGAPGAAHAAAGAGTRCRQPPRRRPRPVLVARGHRGGGGGGGGEADAIAAQSATFSG